MVRNIVDRINSLSDWDAFCTKVFRSETYKHSWFVYADTFNESDVRSGVCTSEKIIAKGLTEAEAMRIYNANKFAVENCGTDYAEIYVENLYDPNGTWAPYVYRRATGEKVERAFELVDIALGVRNKFEAMGLYN